MYKRLNYKLCYLTREKLAAETCLARTLQHSIKPVYLYCTVHSVSVYQSFLYKSASNPLSLILLAHLKKISTFIYNLWAEPNTELI
jgi:hypothetical protein